MRTSTITSSSLTLFSNPINSAASKPQSHKPKQTQASTKLSSSTYCKQGAKLASKMLSSGQRGLKQKTMRFACQAPGFRGSRNASTSGAAASTLKVQESNGSGKSRSLTKPFSRNLIYATSKERAKVHAQAIKDAKTLLTKKDKTGRSLKTRLHDMLVKHWVNTGQSVMSYSQYEKQLDQAMKAKVNWASNHFWNKLGSGCKKAPCRLVESTFKGMKPTTLGVGGVIRKPLKLLTQKDKCPKKGSSVCSSGFTATMDTPIISVRDNGVKHSKGLAHTVAHEYLHVFFYMSGALNRDNQHHNFTRKLGLGGTDDSRTAYASSAKR